MASSQPLLERLKKLVQDLQFYWWLGCVILVYGNIRFFISSFFFRAEEAKYWYYVALFGALVSYSIVLYKTYGVPRFNISILRNRELQMRYLADGNIQYFAIALFWWMSSAHLFTLIPFSVYAVFYIFNYLISNVIPILVPNLPPGSSTSRVLQSIGQWSKSTFPRSASLVAYIEVVLVMGSLILGVITFQTSLVAAFTYAYFLVLRYVVSAETREAFLKVRQRLDVWLLPPTAHPLVPPFVGRGYVWIKRQLEI